MKPLGFWTPRELSNLVLRALEAKGVQAAGFVVEEKIDDEHVSYVVIQDWISKGHIVGNNTYSYIDLNEISADDFLSDVAEGAKYLRMGSRGHELSYRYLRFPMLHEGDSRSKKKSVARSLYLADYQIVPATVIPSDFEFNWIYSEYEDDLDALEALKKVYLKHLSDCLDYAERQSELVFGGPIKHILRLHLGIATANYMDDILDFLSERGYQFVSLPEALSDPAYKTEEDYVGPLGLTFTDRVAATRLLSFDPEHASISRDQIKDMLLKEGDKKE